MEIKVLTPCSKTCPLNPNPCQFDQLGNVTAFLKIRLILSFYLFPGLQSGTFLSGIPTKSLCALYIAVLSTSRGKSDEIFRSDRVKLRQGNLREATQVLCLKLRTNSWLFILSFQDNC